MKNDKELYYFSGSYAIGYMPDNTLKCFYKEDKDKTFCESLNLPTDKVWQ